MPVQHQLSHLHLVAVTPWHSSNACAYYFVLRWLWLISAAQTLVHHYSRGAPVWFSTLVIDLEALNMASQKHGGESLSENMLHG